MLNLAELHNRCMVAAKLGEPVRLTSAEYADIQGQWVYFGVPNLGLCFGVPITLVDGDTSIDQVLRVRQAAAEGRPPGQWWVDAALALADEVERLQEMLDTPSPL